MASAREFGDDLLTRLLTFAVEGTPGANGAGLSIAAAALAAVSSERTTARSMAAVGTAGELDRAQWERGEGPIWKAFRSGRMVLWPELKADPADDPPWPDDPLAPPGAHQVERTGVTGVQPNAEPSGRPATAQLPQLGPSTDRVRGAIFHTGEWGSELPIILSIYLDRPPDNVAIEQVDRYEPMLSQALAVVEYCAGEEVLAQQMIEMNQYRRVIEQAKGLVIGVTRTDSQASFAVLVRASQHFNVRLRNLAVALVEHVSGAEAERPEDPDLAIDPSRMERDAAANVWAALTAARLGRR